MSQALAVKIWEKCAKTVQGTDRTIQVHFNPTRDAWDNFLTVLNDTLNPLDLEIAHMHDEITGKEMIALVNRRGDELAQIATDYSAIEIAYFKAVVEQIILASNESYCVSSLAALREVGSLKTGGSMSKTQAEVVLGSFVANGWLIKSRKGRYSLSTRTLLELLPYFKNTYPDELTECTICMEVLTRGIACATPNCQTRMHSHCFANYRKRHAACPTCKESWAGAEVRTGARGKDKSKGVVPVGEDAFVDGQDQRRNVRRKESEEGEEEEENEEEEAEPEEPSQTQEASQPSRTQDRRKRKNVKMAVVSDDDEDNEDEAPTQPRRRGRR